MSFWEKLRDTFQMSYTDDAKRRRLMFRILDVVLCLVALTMSVMNIITGEYVLFCITASYSFLCIVDLILSKYFYRAIEIAFTVETIFMLSAFIVTGIPDGFSLLWTLLIPACAMSIFGRRYGTVFSSVLFAVIIFFFWLPFGRELLLYEYSKTYMLRFPFVYVCIYCIAYYVEWIRLKTLERFIETDAKYRWLYRHDALTGAYSRHAFYEEIGRIFESSASPNMATLMVDIDDFKSINDDYGHNIGDKVLCLVADIIYNSTCEHCLSCRWGGEEFLVVMKCEHDPYETAQLIRTNVDNAKLALDDGTVIKFTVSIGISIADRVGISELPEQINRADCAMYSSKHEGKNRVVIYKD